MNQEITFSDNPRASKTEFFDNWANATSDPYDVCTTKYNYAAPAQLVADSSISSGKVLDLGCGTGLLGKLLKSRNNIITLDGIDCSPGMLSKIPPEIYRKLVVANLEIESDLYFAKLDHYDALISCGTFGDFVDPTHLKKFLPLLSQNAHVSIAGGLRHAWSDLPTGITQKISGILAQNGFTRISTTQKEGYTSNWNERMMYGYIHATRE